MLNCFFWCSLLVCLWISCTINEKIAYQIIPCKLPIYQTTEISCPAKLNAKCQVIACPTWGPSRRRRRAHHQHDRRAALSEGFLPWQIGATVLIGSCELILTSLQLIQIIKCSKNGFVSNALWGLLFNYHISPLRKPACDDLVSVPKNPWKS